MINKFPPGFEQDSKNLAIDFDGVIHNFDKGYHDGTCYGDPIPGSLEALQKLSKQYNIIIFTAKAKPDRPLVDGKTGTQLVEEWLNKYGVLNCVTKIVSEKPRAILYIDDNGYRFDNWNNTLKFIQDEMD
jgi:ribonucleotide monophosphatase NagD (HAD superfamily)